MININSNFIDDDNKVARNNLPLLAKLIQRLFVTFQEIFKKK